MLEVRLIAVRVDLQSNTPVLLLQEVAGERSLPIYVGAPEATAIAFAIEGVEVPRPLTHDLIRDILEVLGASLRQVDVVEVRDGTYYAELLFDIAGRALRVSSRPSDAIALALRTGSPLFVDEALMDAAAVLPEEVEEDDAGPDELVGEFLEFLDNVKPEDFQG